MIMKVQNDIQQAFNVANIILLFNCTLNIILLIILTLFY